MMKHLDKNNKNKIKFNNEQKVFEISRIECKIKKKY